MAAELLQGTENQQATNEQVVKTDVSYELNKSDDKVIATAPVTLTLPDNPTYGESHELLAEGGDITVAGGQFPLSKPVTVVVGNAARMLFTGTKWVPECCDGSPSTSCPNAFDDDFIRDQMELVGEAVTADGGPAKAAEYAALFCADGCTQGNLGAKTCGPAAIEADSIGAQGFLKSLSFTIRSIERLVNPDKSVTVVVHREAALVLVADPNTTINSFGLSMFVYDATCCLKLQSFVDLYPQCPCPPPPP